MHIADREVRRVDPDCGTLLLDLDGNVAELTDANFFIVKDGDVITPPTRISLPGVSKQVVLELCENLKIPAFERDVRFFN